MAAATKNKPVRRGLVFVLGRILRGFAVVALVLTAWLYWLDRMPGESHRGELAPLDLEDQVEAVALELSVTRLAKSIGERNVPNIESLSAAAQYLHVTLEASGYGVRRQTFVADGKRCDNVVAERLGTSHKDEIVVLGAHYDSVPGSPGADDNASGVAALLSIADILAKKTGSRTIRFVAFANEESPYFGTVRMGSLVYAKECKKQGDRVVPSEGGVYPAFVPGIGWSDQWAFWHEGYPGVMITDTAPFRYPHYHQPTDTPDKLDYKRMARVVRGIAEATAALVNP